MLTDTHCHLNFKIFEKDLDGVLESAWECGLTRILIPGIDLETSYQVVHLSEKHPNLFAAVGVHPNNVQEWDRKTLVELRHLAHHPRVVAIGEIGLDFYRDRTPRMQQKRALLDQLEFAAEVGKPVIIHSRQALEEIREILADWQTELKRSNHPLAERPGVLHSYEGDACNARQAFDQNFLIGVSGPVTFQNALARQRTIASLPLDSLLLETDAPFLTPHPYRGQRNQPAYVTFIAEKIASLQSIPLENVIAATAQNADRLFTWRALD